MPDVDSIVDTFFHAHPSVRAPYLERLLDARCARAACDPRASAAPGPLRARGLASLRKRRRCLEFQRFLMAFSDRPVKAREISFQRLPRIAWSDTSRKSSAAVQGVFTRCGSRWFCQRLCRNEITLCVPLAG